MGIMRILDESGDTTLAWHPDDPATIANVRAEFERLVARERWFAFAREAGAPAADATLVRRFDETAEEIVLTRPLQGG
jgi:hypothetical protein